MIFHHAGQLADLLRSLHAELHYGVLYCDSSNVIESVLPSEDEVLTLVYMTVKYMDAFGQGIASLCTDGANPYEAFEACRALLDEE